MAGGLDDEHAGEDVYFSVDIEADGAIPLVHSLIALGACVAGTFDGKRLSRHDPMSRTFYAELRPVSDEFDADALEVSGLDRARLLEEGDDPKEALGRFSRWVRTSARGGRPVMVAYPASFDWPWLSAYLRRFVPDESPFGFSSVLDMKTMYATKARVRIGKAAKSSMPASLLSARPHTHHALDDAVEQADLFANIFEWSGVGAGGTSDDR